jgi:hypothetical protein
MKSIFVLIIILALHLNYAQNIEILHKFNVGKEFSGRNLPTISHYQDFMPDDYLLDNHGNFYISEVFNKRIYKYNKQYELLKIIELRDPTFTDRTFNVDNRILHMETMYKVLLQCDKKDNLYVLITRESHFVKLLKYNNKGELVKQIHLDNKLGSGTLDYFIINYWTDNIIVRTFSLSVNKGSENVYIFDQAGNLLGNVDYYLMGSDSNIYKSFNGRNYLQLFKYKFENKFTYSDKLKEISKLQVDKKAPINGISWPFFGVDKNDNYYFGGNSDFDYSIEKFDFRQNKVTEIKIDDKFLSGMNIKTNFNKIKVLPNGEIYWLGLEAKQLANRVAREPIPNSNSNDVNVVLIKIKY